MGAAKGKQERTTKTETNAASIVVFATISQTTKTQTACIFALILLNC